MDITGKLSEFAETHTVQPDVAEQYVQARLFETFLAGGGWKLLADRMASNISANLKSPLSILEIGRINQSVEDVVKHKVLRDEEGAERFCRDLQLKIQLARY